MASTINPIRTQRMPKQSQPYQTNEHMKTVLDAINIATQEELKEILKSALNAIKHINNECSGGTSYLENNPTYQDKISTAITVLAGNNRHNCISLYFCGKDYTRGITIVLGAIAHRQSILSRAASQPSEINGIATRNQNKFTPEFINTNLNACLNSNTNHNLTSDSIISYSSTVPTAINSIQPNDINIKLDKNYLNLINVTNNFITIIDYKSKYFYYHAELSIHSSVQRSGDSILSKQLDAEEIMAGIVNKLASDLQAVRTPAIRPNTEDSRTSLTILNLSNNELENTPNQCFYQRIDNEDKHIFNKDNKQVIIHAYVDENKDANGITTAITQCLNQQAGNNKLTIIPYGIKKSRFHEAHSIFVVVYAQTVFIIDPKYNMLRSYKSISQNNRIELSTHFQSISDSKNCGRYTIYTAVELAKKFLEEKTDFSKNETQPFDLKKVIHKLKMPSLKSLQYAFYTIFTSKIDISSTPTVQPVVGEGEDGFVLT